MQKYLILDTQSAPSSLSETCATKIESTAITSARVAGIDFIRGLIVMLMALGHTRHFFSNARFDPTDLLQTNAWLFFTRWITHFCAPNFMFLAGVSVFLYGRKLANPVALQRFLLTRGAWLVFLELTVVQWSWYFHIDYASGAGGWTLWAIGWSMIMLSLLIKLPILAVFALSAAMIVGHNLLDGIHAQDLGPFGPLWMILHEPGVIQLNSQMVFTIGYPLIPWIGVLAIGYVMGSWLYEKKVLTANRLIAIGLLGTLAFVILRGLFSYGDPQPWLNLHTGVFNLMAFLNVQKYPPSLLYLLMTISPILVFLGLLMKHNSPTGHRTSRWRKVIHTFGQVPFFFYLIHVPFIHVARILVAIVQNDSDAINFLFSTAAQAPEGYGFSLPWVYVTWAVVIMMLYPICLWFVGVKSRHKNVVWLRYL